MKISNFRDLQNLPSGRRTAKVDVEIGLWPFKKVKTKDVAQDPYTGGLWYFVDTGRWTPNFEVEHLERVYYSQKEMENATI